MHRTDTAQEAGYAIGESSKFMQEANDAAVDYGGDDAKQMQRAHAQKKWDRKKKKYINANGADNKKYITTESGTRIQASFKKDFYQEWRKRNKITTNALEGAPLLQASAPPSTRRSHGLGGGGGADGHDATDADAMPPPKTPKPTRRQKMQQPRPQGYTAGKSGGSNAIWDSKPKQRRAVTTATAAAGSELKTPEQLAKLKRIKENNKIKNMSKQTRRQYLDRSGKLRQGKSGAADTVFKTKRTGAPGRGKGKAGRK